MYIVTGNAGKFAEYQAFLADAEQLDIDLVEIQSFDAREIIEHKLREAATHHEGSFVVEDISLYLNALNGLPGPFIKFFWQQLGNEKLALLAERLGDQRATARAWIGYLDDAGEAHFFQGELPGTIVAPRGTDGFGWDPIFQPEGSTETFAEMGTGRKNEFSMRRRAIEQLSAHLKQQGEQG